MTPALRTLGNIVTGSDTQTDAVLQANALPVFANLLRHQRMNIVKEAAWAISNITAGNPNQIQLVIDNNVIGPLIEVLVRVSLIFLILYFINLYGLFFPKGDFKSQKEAAWAITNLTSGGSVEQVIALCQFGVLKPFCDLLTARDDKTVSPYHVYIGIFSAFMTQKWDIFMDFY